ncbi:hypothetical protein [Microvirga sp. TS319]|uniref:hypothetical protein n=1 Tax=Microvirga sp. TS319 TaxID=3241165 RepID=UPI00351A4C3E
MRQVSSTLARRVISFAGHNPFIAAIVPLTLLSGVIAAFVGEQGAGDYLIQHSASLQAGLNKPLDYGDLHAPQVIFLVLLASAAAVIPAYRFYAFLKGGLISPSDKV